MSGVLETRQVAKRADVGEIHFRSLDKPFPDIGEVWVQHDHLVGPEVASRMESQALMVLTVTPRSQATSVRFTNCALRAASTRRKF